MTTELKRKDGQQRKFLGHTAKPRRSRKEANRLMWEVYNEALATGAHADTLAKKFDVSPNYVRWMIWKAQGILDHAREFDPQAKDLHRELLKFVPLAASALETNLKEAEPRTVIAFLQGVGALVPKAEVTHVSEEERREALERSARAINPKLRRALDIMPDEVVTVSEEEKKKAASKGEGGGGG